MYQGMTESFIFLNIRELFFGKVLNTNQEVRYVGFDSIYILVYATIQ